MAKGFKHGAGGGTSLNFKVVGNPKPETAAESTIWIDTDSITSWIFSATEPENPAEGMVWISTGATSAVAFNALKKNGIVVYPMSAKQYVSGAWVDKTAKSYKNGEWVELIPEGMLYYRGNECDPVTGGWSAFVGYSSSYTLGSYTEGSDRITLKLNGDQKCVSAAPANKIDLSKASTLIVNVKRAPSEANHGLYVTPVRTVSACDRAVAKLEELKTGKNVLDVSSLSGQYYIVLNIVMWDSSTDRLEFDEVRYE